MHKQEIAEQRVGGTKRDLTSASCESTTSCFRKEPLQCVHPSKPANPLMEPPFRHPNSRQSSNRRLTPDAWEVTVCRGIEGACSHAVISMKGLQAALCEVARASGWARFAAGSEDCPSIPPHKRLRIAVAACPNACTMPQIRDFGLIGAMTPRQIRTSCIGCGSCEQFCQEDAISVQEGKALFDSNRCVGCGECGPACPEEAIEMAGPLFRIMLGGKMGRHPRFALELSVRAKPAAAASAISVLLRNVLARIEAGEKVADVMPRLSQEVLIRQLTLETSAEGCT